MELYVAKGKVYKVMPLEQKTDKFSKQEFIIEIVNPSERGTFVDHVRFQCINEKTYLIDTMEKGDFVVIKFNITGRKFKNKEDREVFYTNLDVVDLSIVNKAASKAIEIKAGRDTDYSDLIPGLESDYIPGPKEKDEEDLQNDLPF